MGRKFDRRNFVKTSAVAGLAAAAPRKLFGDSPAVRGSSESTPVVISSANGHRYKNGGEHTGVEIAFEKMMAGEDVLDAVIAAVNLNELDPEDASVGYGGLPNADGIVQLDSCCMHGPRRQAGGVACLEGIRTPSLVAQAVMSQTDHHLLVGPDARTSPVIWASRSRTISTASTPASVGSSGSAARTRATISTARSALPPAVRWRGR
jgi:N4-(beta-N-acetylglucosaminyl)-L-asparaginase